MQVFCGETEEASARVVVCDFDGKVQLITLESAQGVRTCVRALEAPAQACFGACSASQPRNDSST
jgi:hypothetical protein